MPDRAIKLLTEAIGYWRGRPFGEFGDEYWAVAESAVFDERRAVAHEERATALLAIGHHAERFRPRGDGPQPPDPGTAGPTPDAGAPVGGAPGRGDPGLPALPPQPRRRDRPRTVTGAAGAVRLDVRRPLQRRRDHRTAAPRVHDPRGDRRGSVRAGVLGDPAGDRADRGDQGDSTRPCRLVGVHRALRDEAQLVAKLEHPHIVPLYDYWREPGGAFLVFRLLHGGTARDVSIADGAWSIERVSRLVEEIGGALMAARTIGVAHNDVSSSNVLLDESGATYLSDFGIAVEDGTEHDDATDGLFSRDVRALGRLAWELLAGEPTPQTCSTADLPPRLIGRVGQAPDGLDAVLARATSRDDGYASVAEFVLAWRAMIGRPDGSLSPITSDEFRRIGSARRLAADRLTRQVVAGTNPYKGLHPFDEADASEFFGRATAVSDLLELVAGRTLVAVVGASGSGKSSLVRAGLAPALRAAGWTVVVATPGEDPVSALDDALLEVSMGREADLDLAERCRSIAARTPLQIVLDQFEECWTLTTEQRRRVVVDRGRTRRGRSGGTPHPADRRRRFVRPPAPTSRPRSLDQPGLLRPHADVAGRTRRRDRAPGGPRRRDLRRSRRRSADRHDRRPTRIAADAAVHPPRALRPTGGRRDRSSPARRRWRDVGRDRQAGRGDPRRTRSRIPRCLP